MARIRLSEAPLNSQYADNDAGKYRICDFQCAGEKYQVIVANCDPLIMRVGFTAGKEPNVRCLHREFVTHEFKHSNYDGAKWWTKEDGVDLYFAIPVSAITVIGDKCGYSYPLVEIGEQEITLNTSGGGMKTGWQDMVYEFVSTCINLPRTEVNAIISVAVYTPELTAKAREDAAKLKAPYNPNGGTQ